MLWITIQFVIFPTNAISICYFIFGFTQLLTAIATFIYDAQSKFAFNENDYPNINNNSKTLVVYFSRMGYTKKYAYQVENDNKCALLELTTKETTKFTKGFWWCGRFGMHEWPMLIDEINIDLSKFDKIIICSPIWVFKVCGPIRDFCNKYKDKINDYELHIVHFRKNDFQIALNEVYSILDKHYQASYSVCTQLGKVKYIKKLS